MLCYRRDGQKERNNIMTIILVAIILAIAAVLNVLGWYTLFRDARKYGVDGGYIFAGVCLAVVTVAIVCPIVVAVAAVF